MGASSATIYPVELTESSFYGLYTAAPTEADGSDELTSHDDGAVRLLCEDSRYVPIHGKSDIVWTHGHVTRGLLLSCLRACMLRVGLLSPQVCVCVSKGSRKAA